MLKELFDQETRWSRLFFLSEADWYELDRHMRMGLAISSTEREQWYAVKDMASWWVQTNRQNELLSFMAQVLGLK